MDRDFQAIAQEDNTTEAAVIREIEFAVACAQKNAPHMWKDYHGTTARDAVNYIAAKVFCSTAQ